MQVPNLSRTTSMAIKNYSMANHMWLQLRLKRFRHM